MSPLTVNCYVKVGSPLLYGEQSGLGKPAARTLCGSVGVCRRGLVAPVSDGNN